MKKDTRLLRLIACLAGAAAGIAVVLAAYAGSWLLVEDPLPPRLDVIFTFGGENARVVYSHELSKKYPGSRWVLSDHDHLYSRILARSGVDPSAISVLDTCSNTLSELHGLADWLAANGGALRAGDSSAGGAGAPGERLDIGLVSSPYHMRRISLMAQDLFAGRPMAIHYLPVPLGRYGWTKKSFSRWWVSKHVRSIVRSEIGKLLLYRLFG